jgi:hypothetical protein
MITKKSEDRPVRTTVTAQSIKRQVQAILICSGFALFALVLSSIALPGTASATPPSGVTQTPIASGVLAEPIRAKFKQDAAGFGDGLDVSNIAIVRNTVQPRGYSGWHQHSGPSWIVVTQGTLTFFDADDPTCTGHPVSAGSTYFDPGNHTFNAMNESYDQVVVNYVVLMLPAGGAPRIDMPNPGVCPQLP